MTSMTVTPPPTTPDGAAAPPPGPMLYGRPLGDILTQVGRDSAYLFLSLPVAIASFVLLITGISLAAGLVVVWVGIPIGAATLGLAVGFERLERARLAARGTVLPPIAYAPVPGVGLRAQLQRLADPKRWAAVLHGVLALVVSVFTWSVLVTWWAGIAGGLSYWFWERWLPEDNTGLADLLSLPVGDAQVNFVLGALLALSLPPVLRWCAGLHVASARWLLTGSSRRALQEQVSDLTARRAAAAAAETASLRRLERDIHDGPQQRLVRLGMDLSAAERRLQDDPAQARQLLAEARAQAAETLAELRALSRGIAPPILADRGLEAALAAVAARSTVPTSVEVDLGGDRPAPAVENAAYFVVTESLANVAKHAEAEVAVVRAWSVGVGPERVLSVEVVDDGVGGADPAKGHGLAGLIDRVEGVGGLLDVSSPAGGPTLVRATLPWD
ncbi:sensor histidine kinase [Actinotalea fermentans]|uniref:histidine kinase n=1 Tax=Actinotalea fermentans TaxID=43671 RepID=A0A511YTA3_9CELL|nr:sensor domain-containing protein [Actinotalea fermentans]KGM15036.1 hypothetical protein N867_12660 [Actinotalea fermentans ATCC 43279 = JCM 9966 = DSM 3133]GEN78412.1 histidine kinase [Actinotalea fermentans]